MFSMGFHITGDPAADQVLDESPFALLAGMMLDQQYPMEHAFRGPSKVVERFGSIDPRPRSRAADPEEFAAHVRPTPPAIHRFPGSMAARMQELARIVEEEYDGDAARIWTEAADGKELLRRMKALPGFGTQKAQIFVALLAKQSACDPTAGSGSRATTRRMATAPWPTWSTPRSLQKVRDHKKQKKAAAKAEAI